MKTKKEQGDSNALNVTSNLHQLMGFGDMLRTEFVQMKSKVKNSKEKSQL